ncbi:MAG: hypothetical protein IMX00_04155 [Limnochordales bacterium]|nr:hypothetical protein [Limnochordales bacterium]
MSFELPDFTRVMWASQRAREVWQPRVEAIQRVWTEVEVWAVSEGMRQAALQVATPEELPARARYVMDLGLVLVPLARQGRGRTYAATTPGIKPGGAWEYRVAICKPEVASEFARASSDRDDEIIGQLLGYPGCCIDFFRRVWVDGQHVDTTWQMATNTVGPEGHVVEVSGPPEANILLRWLGVRAVPHLPCSFTCQATVDFGRRLVEVGRARGYDREMDWLLEMLSWPVEWSALHGIAIIKTPVLQITARTDYTPSKLVVRRQGTSYPEEGAQGLVFPFRSPRGTRLTETKSYRKAVGAE